MENLHNIEASKQSVRNILAQIIEQDNGWWETKEEDKKGFYNFTRHGNLVSAIHQHFRKLEREYCTSFTEEINEEASTATESSQRVENISESRLTSKRLTPIRDESYSNTSLPQPLPMPQRRGRSASREEECSSLPRSQSLPRNCQPPRQRLRHISDDSVLARSRQPANLSHSSRLLHESLRQGNSMSPLITSSLVHSSHESVQSRESGSYSEKYSLKSREFDIYKSASFCCHHPVLALAQRAEDAKSDSEHSGSEFSYAQWDVLPAKDCSRSMSEHLVKYLRLIFHLSSKRHRQYQLLITQEDKGGRQGSKKEVLEDDLLAQLHLLETDTNPYYSPNNFQSCLSYKAWQDRERKEITTLLHGKIPRRHGKHKPKISKRNRCYDYRDLLKKVLAYDFEHKIGKNDSDPSLKTGNTSAGSDTSLPLRSGCDQLLSKTGKRLLDEFAARYRIGMITQLCLYLVKVEECLEDGLGRFDSVRTLKILTAKFIKIQSLIENRMPICNTEIDQLLMVVERYIEKIKGLVSTLLTEWLPTTQQLTACLELAQSCFSIRDLLQENECSEWPDCLSKWFEAATIDDYHAHKRPDFHAAPINVLRSVAHAVDVVNALQKQDDGSAKINYQSVFSTYIDNFPQAVCSGLYEAVMTDVRLLASVLPWVQYGPGLRNQYDGTEMFKSSDVLNLSSIALAYKLAEFDNLVNIREVVTTCQFPYELGFSWRLSYHQLIMHWLDVLSCHMRKQVMRAVALDEFNSPCTENIKATPEKPASKKMDTKQDKSAEATRLNHRIRFGSLLRKDSSSTENAVGKTGVIPAGKSRNLPERKHIESLHEDATEQHCGKENCTEENIVQSAARFDSCQEDGNSNASEKDISVEETELKRHALSSENVLIDTDSSCILISYKSLEDSDGYSGSFHSCSTEDTISKSTKLNAANTSDQSFSTAVSNSTPNDASYFSDSSTCVSSDHCSSLPQLVQDSDPSKISPQQKTIYAPSIQRSNQEDDISGSPGNSDKVSSMANDTPSNKHGANEEEGVCGMTPSLIDVVSVIMRFANFVRSIADTVYTLPISLTGGDSDPAIFTNIADINRDMEAKVLIEIKDRFMQKAIQAICEVIQQYSNNLLNIDTLSLTRRTASCLIERRLLRQIANGKFNKTVLRQHFSAQDEIHCGENHWVGPVAKKMMNRLNNLLILKHGLPDLWISVDNILGSSSDRSTTTSTPSRHSFSARSGRSPTQSTSEFDQSQDTGCSDRSPCTSSSVHTAIFIGSHQNSVDCCEDKNNNDSPAMLGLDPIFDEEKSDGNLSSSVNSGNNGDTTNLGKEEPAIPGGIHGLERVGLGDDNLGLQPYAVRCSWEFLKENMSFHIDLAVKGMVSLVSYKACRWFAQFLNPVLDVPQTVSSLRQRKLPLQCLRLKLTELLDVFAQSIHKDGINAVHENVWLMIMQSMKTKITEFRDVESRVSEMEAVYVQNICTALIEAWYRHPSKPNQSNQDWLVQPIRPSLTLLELYCLPTTSLLNMYEVYEEFLMNFDVMTTTCQSELPNCHEVMLLCMRVLQDRKSFSGEMLHQTLQSIILARNPAISDSVWQDAEKLCQQLLELDVLQFAFKRKPNDRVGLPDLIPVIKNFSENVEESKDNLEKAGRTYSASTGESQQSSLATEYSYSGISNESDNQKTFWIHQDYFYKFSQVRLPLSVMDDMREEPLSSAAEKLDNSFLVKLLLIRSETDKDARRFLQMHGHLAKGLNCFGSCFG